MKSALFLFVALILAACTCCKEPKREKSSLETLPMNSCEAVNAFFWKDLDAYQDRVEMAGRDYQDEQWKVESADPKANPEKMSKLFEVMQKIAYDRDVLKTALNLSEATKELSVKECPMKAHLPRAKQLLETSILISDEVVKMEKENQDKQDALQNKSSGFRMEIPGEKEPVSKAIYGKKLASLKDRAEREKLYKAYNSARSKKWLEWGFKDLVKARNVEGKAAGFNNYYDYKFFRSQLDLANYRSLVKEIKEKLAPKVRIAFADLGKKSGISKVEGWDMRYLREKNSSGEINEYLKDIPETTALEIARKFYSALGIDIDDYHFTMDLYPRPGKNTHAFAMGVLLPRVDAKGNILPEPKMDVRFLANLKKPVIWGDISTVIHELGHAVHMGEVRQPMAAFRGIGSVETEAIAMTIERMAGSEEFLKAIIPQYAKIEHKTFEKLLSKMIESSKIEQAFVLMRQAYFSDFEYEVYKNPDQDIAALWSKMHKEWWGIEIAPDVVDWDVDHFVMAPVYVQNYAIGIVMVEQFYAAINKEFKTAYNSKALGDKLKKTYFAPGVRWDYLELTKQFTGKPLTAQAALGLIKTTSKKK